MSRSGDILALRYMHMVHDAMLEGVANMDLDQQQIDELRYSLYCTRAQIAEFLLSMGKEPIR